MYPGYNSRDPSTVKTDLTAMASNVINTELNDLFQKSEVSVERISVCNVNENLTEHGIHCLPCSYPNNAMDMLP